MSGEIKRSLAATLQLILGKDEALNELDVSYDGLLESFKGLAIVAVIDAVLLYLTHSARVEIGTEKIENIGLSVTLALGIALVAYFASMFGLYALCRTPDLQGRFYAAFTVNNWAAVIVSLIFVPVTLLVITLRAQAPTPDGIDPLGYITLPALFLAIFIGVRLLKVSLNIGWGGAAMLFGITTVVSLTVESWLRAAAGA